MKKTFLSLTVAAVTAVTAFTPALAQNVKTDCSNIKVITLGNCGSSLENCGNILGDCESSPENCTSILGNCQNALGDILQNICPDLSDCITVTPTPEAPAPDVSVPETPENPGSSDDSTDNDNTGDSENSGSTDDSTDNENTGDTEGTDVHPYVLQIVELVNAERAKEGLNPVTLDTQASEAALVRSKEIVNNFSHTRPNGSNFATALKEHGVNYSSAGENIAWGQSSPEEVMNAWMNSSGHRANIMKESFTHIGVGYYQVNGVNYWTQLFFS